MSDALLESAVRFHEAGQLAEAARLYSDIVRANPAHFEALYRLAMIHLQSGRFGDAEHLLAAAIRTRPQVPEAYYVHGCALQNMQRHEDALRSFAQALARKPDYIEARNNRGVSLLTLKRYEEALSCFDKISAVKPGHPVIENNRAASLAGLRRFEEALEASERATSGSPEVALAWYNKGVALAGLDRFTDALIAFDRALALHPRYVDALSYRGVALAMLGKHEEAIRSYDAGLELAPANVDLLYNRATSFLGLKRYREAMADSEAVLKIAPDFKYTRGNLIRCRLQLCDWRDLAAETERVLGDVRAGRQALRPLYNALISTEESDQLECSRTWCKHDCPASSAPLWRGERYEHDKMRIAYVSADFRTHAVASLMAGVFEQHDKSRFDVTAISLSAQKDSMSGRLEQAFDRFLAVHGRDDREVALQMRDMEIDIAIDLMGYTEGSRTGIFALRPAPLQATHLGFPGTMGAAYIDYIIVDPVLVPADRQSHYLEKLVHLPHCYMPGDDKRPIAPKPSRADAGLPETGFVFCSFNISAKIVPPVFEVWMRLLREVEGSVLWLSPADAVTIANLRREAERRGVEGGRLVFAPFAAEASSHLARLSLADLFLDTLPYNAHAGGSDALWAGVPVVTCKGSTFAGRVGASLLNAIGLPELIAQSLDEYEALALKLARDAHLLDSIRAKLMRNRTVQRLFDTKGFTRNLEAAYLAMWERQQRGDPPAAIVIEEPAVAATA
jgi:predicted O-linked N-acetylglucosamine transferase (SPINDLY family)